jgi:membrane associated rhomboid family serine protease
VQTGPPQAPVEPACPRCGVALGALSEGGDELLLCSGCKGVFLSPRALAERFGRDFARTVERAAVIDLPAGTSPARCPRGCGALRPEEVPGADGEPVRLDACPRCGGVWFDRGEVERVRRAAGARDRERPRERPAVQDPTALARKKIAAAEASLAWSEGGDSSGWLFSLLTGLPLKSNLKTYRFPLVPWALVAACVVCFWIQASSSADLIQSYGVIPSLLLERGEGLDRLVTAMFLHGGLLHLLGNLYFLKVFGENVEDRIGRLAYPVLYLVSGIAGNLAHVAMNPEGVVPAIGASGAISGLLGAYLVFFPDSQISLVPGILLLRLSFRMVRVTAFFYLPIWLLWQVVAGLSDVAGVAWWAHVGGFVTGVALAVAAKRLLPDARVGALAAKLAAARG